LISENKVRLSLGSPYKHKIPGLQMTEESKRGQLILIETSTEDDNADGEYNDFYIGNILLLHTAKTLIQLNTYTCNSNN
jgi:hypothetical protein